ncbi:hypothetical protein COLSTE_01480 [Collinsella stercoris DSM 13279]|uniref:Uncharacterized protein n=1 Tax=Collinsella stercoris DSM 13279 TaxID=445975 RepID=B6GBL7_9ACTN|nr:hypothetical protein COLSTE_01480 [Collinsella stercoris DSM 13279]
MRGTCKKVHGRSHRARDRCVYAMSMGAWGVRVCIQPGRAAFSPLRASVRGRAALRHPRRADVRPCGIRVARSAEPVSCRASLLPHIVGNASPNACRWLGMSPARHLRLRRLCGGRAQRGGMGYSLLNVHTE